MPGKTRKHSKKTRRHTRRRIPRRKGKKARLMGGVQGSPCTTLQGEEGIENERGVCVPTPQSPPQAGGALESQSLIPPTTAFKNAAPVNSDSVMGKIA